jgi:glucan phosphoethanolaminetransferase (alkaline phosphatase superfamily)
VSECTDRGGAGRDNPRCMPIVSAVRPTLRQRASEALLWLYLLSPLAVEAALSGESRPLGLRFAMVVAVSLLWLGLLRHSGVRPLLLHLLLLPLYLTTAADLFLLFAFGNRLSAGYIGIVFTDHTEAREFMHAFAAPLAASAVVLAMVLVVGLVGVRGQPAQARRRVAQGCAAVLALGMVGVLATGAAPSSTLARAAWDYAGKDQSAPMGAVWQGALAHHLLRERDSAFEQRETHRFNAVKTRQWTPEHYILVIGESSRPHNWSLMGYERDTTPRLRARAGVVPLPDMLTTAPHTSVAVSTMLSLQPLTDCPNTMAQRSIVSAFAEAGFRTTWLSTQEADAWGGVIMRVATDAQRRRYFDQQLDGVLLPEIARLLDDTSAPAQRQLIVVHTKGSHWNFERRYPPSFDRFQPASRDRRATMLAGYDNSILHTDWLLDEIIALAARRGSHAAVLYASDHGENLLDDSRRLFGHALGTPYDLRTAAFAWLSPALVAALPDAARNLQRNAARPLSLAGLSHSMLELAAIQTADLDPRKSWFSDRLESGPRRYCVRGQMIDEPAQGLPMPVVAPAHSVADRAGLLKVAGPAPAAPRETTP